MYKNNEIIARKNNYMLIKKKYYVRIYNFVIFNGEPGFMYTLGYRLYRSILYYVL